MSLNLELRKLFDQVFDEVVSQLPRVATELLERVPVVIEDRPSPDIVQETGAAADQLLGLYTGIPLTKRSVEHVGEPTEVIHVFREGLMSMCRDPQGQLDLESLREEIRITVLHELGHHFGLDDARLADSGY